jgi:RHS repeat-associated protein
VTGAPTGADALLATNLSSANLTYDVQGNTTKLADETLAYDAAGNNTSTTLSDGTIVAYARDATGAIAARTSTPAGGGTATTIRYSGPFVLNGSGTITATELSLPGGASVEIPATGASVWSYPDLHGDNIAEADGSGVRQGGLANYDPFGQPIDPATGAIGTTTADQAIADNSPGQADKGWAGSAGKLYEHAGDIATIEMGNRQYIPSLGRFIETDAITGGNENDYNYPNDPINGADLSGDLGTEIDAGANGAFVTVPQMHEQHRRQKALAAQGAKYVRSRARANAVFTFLALSAASMLAGNCAKGHDYIIVCGNVTGMSPGDGLTIGNTVFAGSSATKALASGPFMRHEVTHSSQWATYGPFFVGIWLAGWEESVATGNDQSGGGGCLNGLERQAGTFEGSGYQACGWK